jgi:hypothetical protein
MHPLGFTAAELQDSEDFAPKSRTWTVAPLFTLEPVDDATAPFNLSLPQSATKTVRVLSANSTSFTARVVGAEEDARTTFEPIVRVLPATVEVSSLSIERGSHSSPSGVLTDAHPRLLSQDEAQAVLEVTVESMAIPEVGDHTTVVAVRDRSAATGVVSELEVVFQVKVQPKTNLLIFPPNTEPVRASGPGRSDSRVVAGSSAAQRLMFFINVAEARDATSTQLSFTAAIDNTTWSGGGGDLASCNTSIPRNWLQVEMESSLLEYIGQTMNVILNYTYVPTVVRLRLRRPAMRFEWARPHVR